MGKDKKQTVTQTLDPSSQRYVDALRRYSQGAAGDILNAPQSFYLGPNSESIQQIMAPFLDPYIQDVIGGVRGEADRQRTGARMATSDAAIRAGAFGGSRHGIAEGVRLGEIDRHEMNTVGGMLSQGFQNALTQGLQYSEYQRALRERQLQEPIFRHQIAQGFYTGGLGPVGSTQTNVQKGSVVGDIAGLGLIGAGLAFGGPGGAAAAAGASRAGGGGGGFTPPSFMPTPNYHQWYSGPRY